MSRILVTGSNGLIGNALRRISEEYSHDFIFATRIDGDLTSEKDVNNLYKETKPDYVIHTAAKVGGIGLNLTKPADMFYENILMNTFVLHYAYKYNVKKCIAYSSVCSYPYDAPILKEELQQNGYPFKDNFAYGYSKRMIDIQVKAYKKQYGCNFCTVVPTNLYGMEDNYHLTEGHVIPSIIHKCFLAKKNNTPLVLWGDGSPLREFLYSDDAAKLTMEILFSQNEFDNIILSNPVEYSIKDVTEVICKSLKFDGEIQWDNNKPKGQIRRPSDISRLKSVVKNFSYTDIEIGIIKATEWFKNNYPKVRGVF